MEDIERIMIELATQARELAQLAAETDQAIASRDIDGLCDLAEVMRDGHQIWDRRYHELLVAIARQGRSTRSSLV